MAGFEGKRNGWSHTDFCKTDISLSRYDTDDHKTVINGEGGEVKTSSQCE